MKAAVLYGPRDVRLVERPDPVIHVPTDAVVRTVATCVCGSDLWRYRGITESPPRYTIGHEYVGIIEEVGSEVHTVRPGQFVIGGFFSTDNSCVVCRSGMQANCLHREDYDGCQAELIRVPFADGTLVPTPSAPAPELIPSLLTLSDVMGTGWHAAVSAQVQPGDTVAVIGDGAVGLCGILAAAHLGAARIIAMSRHPQRQKIAESFGATDVVEERGQAGVARLHELTDGLGADAVLECVGTQDSVVQALESARPGGRVGWVGVPHIGDLPIEEMFWRNVGLRGGPAPVRAYLPDLLGAVWRREINPGRVFDVELSLDDVAGAYAAMDSRRATKVLLRPRRNE